MALAVVAGGVILTSGGEALAAPSDIKLDAVVCSGTPEVTALRNAGTSDESVAGWYLVSDPVATERFDLSAVGMIPAGGSVFVESGLQSAGTFKWSAAEVFRDNDAADFARLVDATGQTRGELHCAQPTPSPVASLSPSPTPAADVVPNGGGPPGGERLLLSPIEMIYAGGMLAGAGVGMAASLFGVSLVDRGRRRSARATARQTSMPAPVLIPLAAPAAPKTGSGTTGRAGEPLLLALIVAVLAAVLVAFLVQREQPSKRR